MSDFRMRLYEQTETPGERRIVEIAECPDCFALVRVERLKAHENWHDQQLEQWRRDHLEGDQW